MDYEECVKDGHCSQQNRPLLLIRRKRVRCLWPADLPPTLKDGAAVLPVSIHIVHLCTYTMQTHL